MDEKYFKNKYFKYKLKYLKLQQFGGAVPNDNLDDFLDIPFTIKCNPINKFFSLFENLIRPSDNSNIFYLEKQSNNYYLYTIRDNTKMYLVEETRKNEKGVDIRRIGLSDSITNNITFKINEREDNKIIINMYIANKIIDSPKCDYVRTMKVGSHNRDDSVFIFEKVDLDNPTKFYKLKCPTNKLTMKFDTTDNIMTFNSGPEFIFQITKSNNKYNFNSLNNLFLSLTKSKHEKTGKDVSRVTLSETQQDFNIILDTNGLLKISTDTRTIDFPNCDYVRHMINKKNDTNFTWIQLEEVEAPEYDTLAGIIRAEILLEIIPEKNRTKDQLIDSAMVWGALNRAKVPGLSTIGNENLIRYITNNIIIQNREEDMGGACSFVRAYDELSKNKDFVTKASGLLGLNVGGGTA